jgi:hypothetical protein
MVMAKKKNFELRKIKNIELTHEEKVLIAENRDHPLVKLLLNKVLPGRAQNISLTCVSAAQTDNDLWYYKGMVFESQWLPKFLAGEIENLDLDDLDAEYNTDTDIKGKPEAKDDPDV